MTQGNTRYSRQILWPEFGEEGQRILSAKRVFIAGLGGLGSIVAYYLAGAGVGTLVICDSDEIILSNLNRQVLYSTDCIGIDKAACAYSSLHGLNPEIDIVPLKTSITDDNAKELIGTCDLVLDCFDSIQGRHVLNRASVELRIPMIYGGVHAFSGQLTFLSPPDTPCFACLFPGVLESTGPVPVFGPAAGIIGSMQALEAIKYLSGLGGNLRNSLLLIRGLSWEIEVLPLFRQPHCPVCGGIG